MLTDDVNMCVELFSRALYGANACMIRTVGRQKKECNEWFDEECERKKRRVRGLLKSFQRCKTKENKEVHKVNYVKERKEYTLLKRKKKREFDEIRLQKLKASSKD